MMMESQNSGAEGAIGDRIQPIGDAVDVVKVELGSGEGELVKRKRGRPPKAQVKPPPAKRPPVKKIKEKEKEKEEEEDVCFICFDGGSLVLCDHRGCPKAYHPACIKRDEEFFESAAKWNCGWHICSICQKTAHHMCYTCTYSLCRSCVRKADYVCVRDKGFCTICMKTIMLIENNGQGEDGKVQADFDDKLSWEYLFKVYWVYIKGKLSLTLNELTQAKTRWQEASTSSSTLPSTVLHTRGDDLKSATPATSVGNLEEENESKRRKKDEVNIKIETVNMEKPGIDETATTVGREEWATKELLDFVAHMKNGSTAVLSRVDVQALMIEYINRNNLSDPKKKNQIICDSRLQSLFGKPCVGRSQMLKLLDFHFLVKEDSRKRRVNRAVVPVDPEWNSGNNMTMGKDKKRKSFSKVEGHVLPNNLNEFAAVDVHNMNLIYLRRDLVENLLEDSDNFHSKVVGSIVRIRISGCDLKHDMYRLVQVVGTSKVDVPYKINSKLTDITLEVLNLDKKETISIDAISDQEFSEEECRRLERSIRCGLVKHFTVGEIQEKAMALKSVKLNDWMEREISRLNQLCDVASEKGHKKGYRECVEKIQLLQTPEERERRLKEIPNVHFDPKMNPDYESDDTEEYFNKENGDHMESKYSGKNSRPPKKRESRSRKDEKPNNQTTTTSPIVEGGSTIPMEKDAPASTLENSQHEADCNGSTITKVDHHSTLSSSLSNGAPETTVSLKNTSFPNDIVWHYRDPNGKVQGPFSLVQLQRWSTTGYFPAEMQIWANHEDESLLLTDVLKQQFHNHENTTAAKKVGNQSEGVNVDGGIPSSTVAVSPSVPNLVNHEKLSDSQSFGQNWSANNNSNNLNYNPPSVESTVQNTSSTAQDIEKYEADIKHASTAVIDLPGPTPKKMVDGNEKVLSAADSKVLLQDSGNNPPSWSSASSLVVDGAKLPVSANGLGGCSSMPDKREEWDSGIVLEVAADHVATPTSNIEQNVNPSQPTCNDFTWQGVGEMIEFSTLAEESVSDLLAEVDAMESQYGLPSPTSRRNSFVDDLFNGSFDEFSPTPDQGTRSDGFSSSGDIQLPCQSTTTPDEHLVGSSQSNNINCAFDFMKTSNGLQQHSFNRPEINGQTTNVGSVGFKWPEMERVPQGMIDINRSAKAEGEEGEMETKTEDVELKMKLENGNHNIHQSIASLDNDRVGGRVVHNLESVGKMKSGEQSKEMQAPKPIGIGAKLVTRVAQIKGLEGTTTQPHPMSPPPPPPPPPLTLGLDPYDPCDLGSETMQGSIKFSSTGRPGQVTNTKTGRSWNLGWDPNQQKYGGERHNSSNSPRERSHQIEESGYSRNSSSWNRHSSFGSDSGGGGNSRPPAKGQRVCRFYESGKCKKGASCKHLHPSP